MEPPNTIPALLAAAVAARAAHPALLSSAHPPLSHEALLACVHDITHSLQARGIRRGDRVALALPTGPAAATLFLAAACAGTAAPLNPAFTREDFAYYLDDLDARLLIVPSGCGTPAREAARELGIPVAECMDDPAAAGRFVLAGEITGAAAESPAPLEPSDVALVLHTSGTTSRPKRVPLTHANLCASAAHIARTLHLSPDDCCLNVMPLFHIHGLVACVLAPLASGGAVACPGPFDAARFADWLQQFAPTWYSAVPTIHQAVLAALAAGAPPAARSLRFVRSSSSALPPPVMAALESLFGVPVVEAYGMTEAAHQVAANPLPPAERVPGSVGPAAGPEIVILAANGKPAPTGRVGEVAIRGPNVTAGYDGNPEATAAASHDGWFRTGDQGWIDEKGYLFLTGRLKELINRGGEKIAPREIDEALLAHPAVRQAVAFAVPHATLGEDVAAAVVLRDPGAATESVLLSHALERLPLFKAPTRIVIVEAIPLGPTGKLQRIGLADRLREALLVAHEDPVGDTERVVVAAMAEVLGCAEPGRHDNFFACGGDSLRATQVLTRLNRAFGLDLPVPFVFRHPTPALLAAAVDALRDPDLEALARELEALPDGERERLLAELDEPRE
jgi:acyl-CoA synthetase (AMP-forming)/AMP-acid ligase II